MAGVLGRKLYRSRAWQRVRLIVLSRDGWRCVRCGRAGRLEVHHKRHVAQGGDEQPENLETLCLDCHKAEHRRDVTSPAWRALIQEAKEHAAI